MEDLKPAHAGFDSLPAALKEVPKLDYASDVRIDPRNLDWEWLRQADLALLYGNELAEARRKVDNAKEAMDVEESKALLRAFEKVEKPVDKVKATAETDPEYLSKIQAYNKARYEAGLVQAAYDAIQTKKSSLENLVRLHGQQYFAGPSEPKELGTKTCFSETRDKSRRENANEAAKAAADKRRGRTT